ncbi:unnamed protein product [Clonostachys rosea]|uniref:Cytochrome P450 n=1 Tax=Bionectria ochroleuca TaxID=29856 RepID=A0ABY6UM83_BIOOC|nr:unnamed protein product [Clonostachys rosea]
MTLLPDIYGVLALSRRVAKDEFYDRIAGDAHDLVQLRGRGEHSERRKELANAFAAKTVVNMETIIRKTLSQLFSILDKHIDAQSLGNPDPLNLRLWLKFFTLDVIGDTGVGVSMRFLEKVCNSTDAETQSSSRYRVSDTIDTLHKGLRYSLTLENITSLRFIRVAKGLVASVPPLANALGKTCADDFETMCISKLRARIQDGAPDRQSADFTQFERWVDYDETFPNQREDPKKYNIVSSQGSRACIGSHLAIVELQILVSSLFTR